MLPSLALIGIGPRRRWMIPIPLFLLWPLVAVALGVLAVIALVGRGGASASGPVAVTRQALELFCALRGLRIDVRSANNDNDNVNVKVI